MAEASLYTRLGGYDAIAAVCTELISRLRADSQLGRFWANRGEDGIQREYQLLVDFLCNAAGGNMYYTGRDMKLSHKGMRVSASDWDILIGHLDDTLNKFNVPELEHSQVVGFVQSTRDDIVEC